MRRRTVPAVVAVGLVAAVLGLVPGDEATGHTCVRVENTAVTSTTLGDPTCEFHDPADHACVLKLEEPKLVACVDVS